MCSLLESKHVWFVSVHHKRNEFTSPFSQTKGGRLMQMDDALLLVAVVVRTAEPKLRELLLASRDMLACAVCYWVILQKNTDGMPEVKANEHWRVLPQA